MSSRLGISEVSWSFVFFERPGFNSRTGKILPVLVFFFVYRSGLFLLRNSVEFRDKLINLSNFQLFSYSFVRLNRLNILRQFTLKNGFAATIVSSNIEALVANVIIILRVLAVVVLKHV